MSENERLPSEFVIQAALRQWQASGGIATIVHRGDSWGGAIVLKLNWLDGTFQLLTQTRDPRGNPAWLRIKDGARLAEADADAYIRRQLTLDPDLWVIEIDDREGRHPFPGAIV